MTAGPAPALARVEVGPGFDPSMAALSVRFSLTDLAFAVVRFVRWKREGGPSPFSADKASGERPDGTLFQAYRACGIRHCHLDLDGTEPLLAYRQTELSGAPLLVLLCVTTHTAMFHGNERRFLKAHADTRRRRPFPA